MTWRALIAVVPDLRHRPRSLSLPGNATGVAVLRCDEQAEPARSMGVPRQSRGTSKPVNCQAEPGSQKKSWRSGGMTWRALIAVVPDLRHRPRFLSLPGNATGVAVLRCDEQAEPARSMGFPGRAGEPVKPARSMGVPRQSWGTSKPVNCQAEPGSQKNTTLDNSSKNDSSWRTLVSLFHPPSRWRRTTASGVKQRRVALEHVAVSGGED
ncbi:MAG: hypothetical protein KatS3mg111_0677 [Pirellulaceae bacterium]|nr:MAG: hypothetical protein KatS3mg111_0677 [Pirellulaceae bacterium]